MLGYLLRGITRNIMGEASFNSQALLPQAKMVTVICPICGKEIEISDYPRITRTDALLIYTDRTSVPGQIPRIVSSGAD
ncbi:hypothetical protein ACFLXC_00030 [Chloroflexota bacterium]